MSMHFGALRSALVAASAIALAAVCGPANAWDGHRHHHGSDAFFSFGYSSGPYYYDPYPYGPVYAFPPAYAEPPDYAYEPQYPDDEGTYSEAPGNGPYCREFQTTIVIDGRPQSAHGTACQQEDGTWAVVN